MSGVGAYVARIDHALGQGQGLYPAPASGPLHPPTDLPPTPPPPPGTSATATGASTAAAGYQGQWNTGTALDEHTTTNATAGRAEAQAGRGGATAVRATAATQAAAIAPATSSPAGVKLLVTAMDDKLAAMQRQLSTTQDQNRLLATRMRQLAAAYTRIGGTMTPTSPTTPTNSMTPLLGAGPAMTNSLGSLSQLGSGAGSAVSAAASPFAQSGSWTSQDDRGIDRLFGNDRRSSDVALKAVQFARTKLGRPYIWGAVGPRAYDCSGLVQAAYRQAGIELPRTTYQMIHTGHEVSRSDIRPGDLILSNFSRPGVPEHVQLAISSSMVIEAPRPGGHVQISSIPSGQIAVRRVVR